MLASIETIAFVDAIVVAASIWLYRAALPKPIAGIPCDPKSARSVAGDVPGALQYLAETGEMVTFLEKKCKELGTPIFQIFMRPFGKPWVVLVDGRE